MRFLLAKDLRILRRSPLMVGLLVLYPIAIALLFGIALSRAPEKPKVAFLNLVPPAEKTIQLGSESIDASKYSSELFRSIQPIRVNTRKQAIDLVKSGKALAALIIPADVTAKLATGLESARVDVIYNSEDPIKGNFVDQIIHSRLADANEALAAKLRQLAGQDIDLLQNGGNLDILGRSFRVLGLRRTKAIVDATVKKVPPGTPGRRELEAVAQFATLAVDNLNLSNDVLGAVSRPIEVNRISLHGKRTPLDSFAVAVAATVSLMFVTMFLAAGMLAHEREEHTYGRLVRGLVSRTGLLVEKGLVAGIGGIPVALVMLLVVSGFVSVDRGRIGLWLAALGAGAAGFSALGVAIGSLTREIRTASLLAFLLTLPLAFLALVPSGAVSPGLYDAIRAISAIFPFKPALQATNNALNNTGTPVGTALLHLAAVTAAYGLLARVALRRFA